MSAIRLTEKEMEKVIIIFLQWLRDYNVIDYHNWEGGEEAIWKEFVSENPHLFKK